MIYSIGFMFTLLILTFAMCYVKKQYKLLLVYIPILALWLTVLASPVYAEFRYIYSLFVCMPIFIALSINTDEFSILENTSKAKGNKLFMQTIVR